jgi:hypothetical protein
MDTADSQRVLVALEPLLIASAFATLLDSAGFTTRVYDARHPNLPNTHICVALVDETAPREARRGTTVTLPPGSAAGLATVTHAGDRFTFRIERPAELIAIVEKALSACECRGTRRSLALVC